MDYSVEGNITFYAQVDITADTEEEAYALGKEIFDDFYHMRTTGAHHNPEKVKYDIEAIEYED